MNKGNIIQLATFATYLGVLAPRENLANRGARKLIISLREQIEKCPQFLEKYYGGGWD